MSSHLYRFAKLLEIKYLTKQAIDAENLRSQIVEHIKQMLANAATQSSSGIMNFPAKVASDGIKLTLDILKDGKNVTVQKVSVSNPMLQPQYQLLADQIKKYLERNWELFPYKYQGDSVSYDDFTFQLSYGEESGIAAR